jgi:HTH-type transcriptional regulator, competence development regulator
MNIETDNTRLKEVGARIRALRDARGLTLNELARLCGISGSALSLIETGKRDLRISSFFRIADALRLPPGLILAEGEHASSEARANSGEGYDLRDYA